MKQVINPGFRNHPCDHVFRPGSDIGEREENDFTCARCGAESSLEESLCAPQSK